MSVNGNMLFSFFAFTTKAEIGIGRSFITIATNARAEYSVLKVLLNSSFMLR